MCPAGPAGSNGSIQLQELFLPCRQQRLYGHKCLCWDTCHLTCTCSHYHSQSPVIDLCLAAGDRRGFFGERGTYERLSRCHRQKGIHLRSSLTFLFAHAVEKHIRVPLVPQLNVLALSCSTCQLLLKRAFPNTIHGKCAVLCVHGTPAACGGIVRCHTHSRTRHQQQ